MAALNGSHEIVKSLLDHGSPTSYLNDPKTPLSISIKNRDLRISYQLIENGADPDSDESNSPINFAIKNNDDKAFRLLLFAGASTSNLNSDDINKSENLNKVYELYAKEDEEEAFEDKKAKDEIVSLDNTFEQLKKNVNDFISRSKDSNFLSSYFTPIISEINGDIVGLAQFIQKLEIAFHNLNTSRCLLLKSQLHCLEQLEEKEIEEEFDKDNQGWINMIDEVKKLLQPGDDLPDTLFPGNCYEPISNLPSKYQESKNDIFKPSKEIDFLSITKNRTQLLFYNDLLKQIKKICGDAHDEIYNFSKVVDKILCEIEKSLIEMRNLVIREMQLNFDFKDKDFGTPSSKFVDDSLMEKRNQLDLDLAFLTMEKEKSSVMFTNLLKVIRLCIR